MTEEQKKEFDKFLDIAVQKGYNQIVCLAAAGVMLSSSDWKKTLEEIITVAEKCKDCGDFAHQLIDYLSSKRV